MKDCEADVFVGKCWPGASVYVDFLNEEACQFWSSLYLPAHFSGTDLDLYDFWIDMNEPSVFDSEEVTIPRQSYHTTTTDMSSPFRKKILHRDIHNAYGLFETKATWNALLQRNRAF